MASAERFLIDKSAHERLSRQSDVLDTWRDVLLQGRIGISWPTEIEILYSSRSAREYAEVKGTLADLYTWVGEPDDVGRLVLGLQEKLCGKGLRRSAGAVDPLVSVIAEANQLTVLHYDRDFETIASITGQPTRWLAQPGGLD
ncbi:PIN domain nuclease [Streptomycetaceae bacterium NBC_01309]